MPASRENMLDTVSKGKATRCSTSSDCLTNNEARADAAMSNNAPDRKTMRNADAINRDFLILFFASENTNAIFQERNYFFNNLKTISYFYDKF